ncbi:thiamine-phosphate kinase [Hydrogenovibrio kuenenii]|uniref:thiamine-phosphate kinase n=1 Tax=Hydrogenovibrio kuenenii TaxID=63658 RepID=UPI0004662BD3|nr:thiamine-phosphate kinase [Hydrogenovibrio kuenenii]
MSEFSIIDEFFKPLGKFGSLLHPSSADIGIGDDGAVMTCPKGMQLVIVTDTLVEGVHFPLETQPYDIAWKALAVNLSDLAAMGAQPAFYSLGLSLPQSCANEAFLSSFSKGLKGLSSIFDVPLVGGDTTKSDRLTLTVTAHGWVEPSHVLRRSNASVGDKIYVTGKIGDGALALQAVLGNYPVSGVDDLVFEKFYRPMPRVELGLELKKVANAAIDISDGLVADLSHLLDSSNVSAEIDYKRIPFSSSVEKYIGVTGDAWLPITGGDDYELCFTLSDAEATILEDKAKSGLLGVSISCIGKVIEKQEQPVVWLNRPLADKECSEPLVKGYEHF